MGYRELPHLRIGEQLWLFKGEPWEGVAPRVLTAGFYSLFLRPEPPRHAVCLDSAQLELWPGTVRPQRRKRPPPAEGASLLLPLKEPRASARGSRRGYLEG